MLGKGFFRDLKIFFKALNILLILLILSKKDFITELSRNHHHGKK